MLTHFLKSNNNTQNIDLKRVIITNKVIRANSRCATFWIKNQDF